MSYSQESAAVSPQRVLILESYPWAFYEDDQVKGAAIEWLNDLAETRHLALSPVVTSYARGVDMLKHGQIDYMIAPASPRYRELGSPALPLMTVSMMLVARPGIALTETERPLPLKSLGIAAGLSLREIEMVPLQVPVPEDMHPAGALRRMAAGRLDALIVSNLGLQAEALRQEIPIRQWPQRIIGTITLSLFTAPRTVGNPQTPQVLEAVRVARDTGSYIPFITRYLPHL